MSGQPLTFPSPWDLFPVSSNCRCIHHQLDMTTAWDTSHLDGVVCRRRLMQTRPFGPAAIAEQFADAVCIIRLRWYIKQLDARFPFLGLKPQLFAMHSFRRGGITNAWECGVDRELLRIHGRWRSDAIDAYLQAPTLLRLQATGIE